MAESIFGDLASERGLPFSSSSAGVEARPGFDMAPNTRTSLQEMGFPAGEHRSRPITQELVSGSDLILTMSRKHSEDILGRFDANGKVLTLPQFVGDFVEPDISDPYRLTIHAYRATQRRILGYVERALDRMERESK